MTADERSESIDRLLAASPRTVAWALVVMTRPAQLALICLVYAFGVAIALAHGATPSGESIAVGAAVLLPAAASVHYANEYADHDTDALTDRTRFSGGSGALPNTELPPALALWAGVTAGLLAVLVALGSLAARGSLSLAAAVTLGAILLVGWQYSIGPLKLAWNGAGEVTNAALGGLALPIYGYVVAAGRIDAIAVLAPIPFAVVVFVNLLETTWPDRRADAAVGKETLATRWSAERLSAAYAGGVVVAVASALALHGRVVPMELTIASLLPVPLLLWGVRRFTRRETPFPAVAAMVLLVLAQTVAWLLVAGVLP